MRAPESRRLELAQRLLEGMRTRGTVRLVRKVPEGLAENTHVKFGGSVSFGWLSNDFDPDGYIGDPTGANAELGKELFEGAADTLAEAMAEVKTFDFGR